jgi:hypothetical protein
MINFSHRFLLGVARILQPLTAALAGNTKVLTSLPTMSTASPTAKAGLVATVPLAYPLLVVVLSLATDASDNHIGAVLQQQVGQH